MSPTDRGSSISKLLYTLANPELQLRVPLRSLDTPGLASILSPDPKRQRGFVPRRCFGLESVRAARRTATTLTFLICSVEPAEDNQGSLPGRASRPTMAARGRQVRGFYPCRGTSCHCAACSAAVRGRSPPSSALRSPRILQHTAYLFECGPSCAGCKPACGAT